MIEAGILLVGIIVGYGLCYFAGKGHLPQKKDDQTVLVKRNRMSLRNPLQTNRTQYDKFKTRSTGLYSPVKPKGENKEEVDIGH